MRSRPKIPPRKRLFIGTEGSSEKALCAFLQELCDGCGLDLHLHVSPGTGGSPASILENALKQRRKGRSRGPYVDSLCIIDADRFDFDPRRQELYTIAAREDFKLVRQTPNFEGLLVRFHPGNHTRVLHAAQSLAELQRLWPEYRKPPIAKDLRTRFSLHNLQDAAQHDQEWEIVLRSLRLLV